MPFSVKKIQLYNLASVARIARILTDCGSDMYQKYGLGHWKNPYWKTLLIVFYSFLKNEIFCVFDEKSDEMSATFQIHRKESSLHFSKLSVSPSCSGKGVGGYCLQQVEKMAHDVDANKIICEVYDKSTHAFEFYKKRGFKEVGQVFTRKYRELVLEKEL